MRRLFQILLFIFLFLTSLYLTFPFERFALNLLSERGVSVSELSFHHFTPSFTAEELVIGKLDLKDVQLKPSIFLNRFELLAKVCSGSLKVSFDRKLENIRFHIKGVKLESCPVNAQLKVKGTLGGDGTLSLKGGNLVKGRGVFNLENVVLSDLNFGIFSYKFLDLGRGEVNYRVSGKNFLRLDGELSGRDADVKLKGDLSVNLKSPDRSYLNLKVFVKVKTGNFRGKSFNFTVRGNLNSLRFF